MPVPLEDNFTDVIGKAQRGLGISDSILAEKTSIPIQKIRALRDGRLDSHALQAIAPVLGLDPRALLALAEDRYLPAAVPALDGLAQFNTPFDGMTVNSYLVWDPASRLAAAVDTGSDCSPILDHLAAHRLTLGLILLTHTHGDHIFDLDRLQQRTGAPAFVSALEPLHGAQPIQPGHELPLGALLIRTRLTWGHSKGGLTYVVQGLRHPVALVGDALFAGSMGGGAVSYRDALATNRSQILTLPPDTILCPGHGPLTTVAEQLLCNPFFSRGT